MDQLLLLPREEKENNREYACRVLRYNILTLHLIPGSTLNENDIAEQIGISRTPVHESLTTLKSEYLVEIIPQSGSRVSLISLQNVREGLFLRQTIEPAIYRQIAGNVPRELLRSMEQTMAEAGSLVYATDRESTDRCIKLDDEFHRLAYEAAHKPLLWTAVRNVCSHYDRIRYLESILLKQDLKHVYAEHEKLYEYLLLAGSPDFDLEDFYNRHLSYFKGFFPSVLKKYPAYFITC